MRGLRQDFGEALWRLSDLVRADERRRSFRAKAYRSAVWALDDLSPDLSDSTDQALSVSGIGSGMLRLIDEFVANGRLEALDRLAAMYPKEVARLRRLPRMNPGVLRALKTELGVETAEDLVEAVEPGGVETLKGVGPATAEKWAAILRLDPGPGAVPAFQASLLGGMLANHLGRHLGGRVVVAGGLRRAEEWVDRIELVAGVEDRGRALEFLETTAVARYVGEGAKAESLLLVHDGTQARVHLVDPGGVERRMFIVTGPTEHAEPLLTGATEGDLDEAGIYAANGRLWVPPPARSLPSERAAGVVRTGEIRGDLHLHTDRSPDGRMSILEILVEAVDRGYEYVLITDHTSGLRFGGLDADDLDLEAAEIDEIRGRFPDLVVLHGAEVNIGRDGTLDLDDDVLERLDLVVAGVHSFFDLERTEQTARVLAAMSHPKVGVLAHPTGRRIGARPPIDVDLDTVVSSAVAQGVALEVNGHLDRLDLPAPLVSTAVDAGALLAANSDAHRPSEMGNIANAVATMQRAGVGPDSVVNTWPIDRFMQWATSFPVRSDG